MTQYILRTFIHMITNFSVNRAEVRRQQKITLKKTVNPESQYSISFKNGGKMNNFLLYKYGGNLLPGGHNLKNAEDFFFFQVEGK